MSQDTPPDIRQASRRGNALMEYFVLALIVLGATIAFYDNGNFRGVTTAINGMVNTVSSTIAPPLRQDDPTTCPPLQFCDSIDGPGPFDVRLGPCPFNTTVNVFYTIPTSGSILAEVFAVSGGRVATLRSGTHKAGKYKLVWDPRSAGARAGEYYVRVTWNGSNIKDSNQCMYVP